MRRLHMAHKTYAREPLELVSADLGALKYDSRGLISVVVQQFDTGEVLMVAWANKEALKRTIDTKTSWFWSRSRQELWNKGATSGNIQQMKQILIDCDADALLYLVDSPGPACHTGHRSCFYREMNLSD